MTVDGFRNMVHWFGYQAARRTGRSGPAKRDAYYAICQEFEALKAEADRMRPVYEAAMRYCRKPSDDDYPFYYDRLVAYYDLCGAADAARAATDTEGMTNA